MQEKIDYSLFKLGNIYKQLSKRSPIEMMIDKATGYDKELMKKAKTLMKKIDIWKKEYYEITGKTV